MTSFIIAIPRQLTAAPRAATLLSEHGGRVVFDHIEAASTRDGAAGNWNRQGRTGRKPLSRRTEEDLKVHTFSARLGGLDLEHSIEPALRTLETIARRGDDVQLLFGPGEAGWWNVTSLSVNVVERTALTHSASRATVGFTLTEATTTSTKVGARRASRKHRVRKGDTLYKLAVRFYGRGSRWKEIARANKIRNPKARSALRVGRVLRIPPR